ncbi:AI-2E family transporter [Patescibacteria group bacterium]|nr:AI-2E family transporter [Patescibacteria group bacterium]
MIQKVEISHKTVIFTVLFLLLLWFLYFIRDIILGLFVALLIMAILNPIVSKLYKFKIPRGFSVLVVYIAVLGIFGLVIAAVVPPLVEQTSSLVSKLPIYISTLGIDRVVSREISAQFLSQIGSLPGQAVKIGFSIFSNILGVITVLIFAFYLLLVRDKIDDQLVFLFGENKKEKVGKTIDMLESRLGGWARAELALMLVIGVASFLGLTILGIPYALPLAILAGLLEIVPYFGPIISAIPAVIIGLSISPLMGLATVALALLIHQSENYLFTPKIMEKSVGVNPIITLLALSIGFRLAGMAGAVISVPVVLTIHVLASQYIPSKTTS